ARRLVLAVLPFAARAGGEAERGHVVVGADARGAGRLHFGGGVEDDVVAADRLERLHRAHVDIVIDDEIGPGAVFVVGARLQIVNDRQDHLIAIVRFGLELEIGQRVSLRRRRTTSEKGYGEGETTHEYLPGMQVSIVPGEGGDNRPRDWSDPLQVDVG